jgi:DNA-binding transcriptional regulator YbjK
MVDGSDEEDEDGKSKEERINDIEKQYRKVEAKNVLQKNWRVHHARKELEKLKNQKDERKARAHDIFMDLRTNHQKDHKEIDHELWRDFKIQHQRKREEEGGVLSV